jgi:hypothetical protein
VRRNSETSLNCPADLNQSSESTVVVARNEWKPAKAL